MKAKLNRLRRTSFDELRVRSSQLINAFAERRGWSRKAKLVSDSSFLKLLDQRQFKSAPGSPVELLEHFRGRMNPTFFSAFVDPTATVVELRRRWPDAEKEIVDRADRILQGSFDLLAFHNLHFGTPIDWHLEPVAKKRAPLVHWSRLNYLDAELFGDKKIIWELNRHQYFITLGQAYWLTGDEHYADIFANQLNEWMVQNPPKLGINWASSLEVAFRSIAWLWSLHFFKNSSSLTPQTFARVFQFLYINASHLESYLSTYFSPNTHLTGEALGLFYLGSLLPEFKESARWRNTGLRILLAQLERHVRPDGVYFEQSSYYHRYTTDFYLHLWLMLSANGETPSSNLTAKLKLLLDHLMYITRPDGTTPLFGDDDGGRLLPLDYHQSNDFRSTLSTGAAVFERPDYKFVAGGPREETLWLVGPKGLAALDGVAAEEPAKQSNSFDSGGYYVMRDGWTPDSNYLLFDCGPHGIDNCGHAHADALSFDLAAHGRTLLVDPGTCTYTGSKDLRDWFRSSAAHNTLTVDQQSSSIPNGAFSWKTIAHSVCSSWLTQERFDYVSASHDGFDRLPNPAVHTRSILFLKNNYWVVRDRVESAGTHLLRAGFHLDSGTAPLYSNSKGVRVVSEDSRSAVMQIDAFAPGGEWQKEPGWVSHCYGEREEAPAFSFSVLASGSAELVTFLLPERLGVGSRPSVREIEALNGRAFEVNLNGKHDVIIIRDLAADSVREWVETVRIASDFNLSWARFVSEDAHTPEELILIDGHTLEMEGRTLLRSTKKINYLAVRRVGDRFRVETDEGVLEIVLPVTDLEALFAKLNQGSGVY